MTLLILLTLVSGCGGTWRPSCEQFVEPVDDDEVLPSGRTVAGILAEVGATQHVATTWPDGSPADVSVTTRRGAGPAEWVRQEPISVKVSNKPLLGRATQLIAVTCNDHLRFPAEVSMESDDDTVTVSDAPATATTASLPPEEGLYLRVSTTADEVAGLPPFDDHFGGETTRDGDPLVPDYEFATIDYLEDDTAGSLGWGGDTELDDGTHMSWARRLLDWRPTEGMTRPGERARTEPW